MMNYINLAKNLDEKNINYFIEVDEARPTTLKKDLEVLVRVCLESIIYIKIIFQKKCKKIY